MDLLFINYSFRFSVSGKVFCVIQKHPGLLISVCRYAKSTPWDP